MPSTTVHIPDKLLSRIDKAAKELEISRNRYVIQACEQALENSGGKWPEGFFDQKLSKNNQELLEKCVSDMEKAIMDARKNRKAIEL